MSHFTKSEVESSVLTRLQNLGLAGCIESVFVKATFLKYQFATSRFRTLRGELKHEIFGETINVALNGAVEGLD